MIDGSASFIGLHGQVLLPPSRVRNVIHDEEGLELPDRANLREAAIREARSVMQPRFKQADLPFLPDRGHR
jgi:hypothetical protein